MLDAVSDLVETLLRHDATDAKVSLGMSIVESVMSNSVPVGIANQLLVAQQVTGVRACLCCWIAEISFR